MDDWGTVLATSFCVALLIVGAYGMAISAEYIWDWATGYRKKEKK